MSTSQPWEVSRANHACVSSIDDVDHGTAVGHSALAMVFTPEDFMQIHECEKKGRKKIPQFAPATGVALAIFRFSACQLAQMFDLDSSMLSHRVGPDLV